MWIDFQSCFRFLDAGSFKKTDCFSSRFIMGHGLVEHEWLYHLVAYREYRVQRGHGLLKNHGDVIAANGAHFL